MKKIINKFFYLSILIFSLLSCYSERKTESEYLKQSKTDKIDTLANRYLELNRFSGTILIAENNKTIYHKSYGKADYENNNSFSHNTAFKIGEITELITDNIISRLLKEGKIDLTDKLSKYLTGIDSNLIINDVLTKNSNIDYNNLGKLIEKVSDKSYQLNIEEYSQELALENTYFSSKDSVLAKGYLYHNYQGKGLELQVSPHYNLDSAYSSRGLKSTPLDLLKIIKSNPRELKINGFLEDDGFSYSLENNIANNTSIIILSNRRHPITSEMLNGINAILQGKEFRLPLARKPFDIDKTILRDFAGNYSLNEYVNFEVLTTNDSLFVILGPNKTYLSPQSANQFYMLQMDASMKFLRDSTNQVSNVLLLNGFIDSEQTASRIEAP